MKIYTRRRKNKKLQDKNFTPPPNEQKDPNEGGEIEKVDSKTYIIKKDK